MHKSGFFVARRNVIRRTDYYRNKAIDSAASTRKAV